MSDEGSNEQKPRKRGLTSMTLQWIADKFRRAEQIKNELNSGTYQIDSNKIARAILNGDGQQ